MFQKSVPPLSVADTYGKELLLTLPLFVFAN